MSVTGSGTDTIEIVHNLVRRRWTAEEKVRIVEESMRPGVQVTVVARQNGVSPALLYKWRRLMADGGRVAVASEEQVVSLSEAKALKKRIAELERALGRKTMEVEILKEAVIIAREKKLISPVPLSGVEGFQ